MIIEQVDRRILGAVRFLDSTTRQVLTDFFRVESQQARFVRNRSGLYVIAAADGFEDYTNAFLEAPAVVARTVSADVSDPAGQYLARRFRMSLPRDIDPARAAQAASVFQAVDVPLFPAPAAATAMGWAVVRAHVERAASGAPLGGALIRVTRTEDGALIGSGISDRRGEALVAVAGIPITTFGAGAGPAAATEIEATLQAIFDPAAGQVPDPDDLEARRATLPSRTLSLQLASGREAAAVFAVTIP